MALSPEHQALRARCEQALNMGAGLARIDAHLASLGAGPAPAGVSKEQHLLNVLAEKANGTPPAPVAKADVAKAEETHEVDAASEAEEPAQEAATEKKPKKRR